MLQERGFALEVGVLRELDEDDCPKAAFDQPRRQQSDRPRDSAVGAQSPQATCDRRGRQRHVVGERLGGSAVITLDEVEEQQVEAVEHAPHVPNFGRRRIKIAHNWQSNSVLYYWTHTVESLLCV